MSKVNIGNMTNEEQMSAGMPFGSNLSVSLASSAQMLSPEGSGIFMHEVFNKNSNKDVATKRKIEDTFERNKKAEEGSLGKLKRNECMGLFHEIIVTFFENCVKYYEGSLLAFEAPGGYLKGFPTLRNFQIFNYDDEWIILKKKELEADFNQVVIGSSLAALLVKYSVPTAPELKAALRTTYKLVQNSSTKLGNFVTTADSFFDQNPISLALMGAGGKNVFRQQYGDRRTRIYRIKDFLKNQKQRAKLFGTNKPKKGKPGARDPSIKKEEIWDDTDETEEEEPPNESEGTT